MTPLAAVSNPPLTFRSGILEQELTSTFLGLGATDEPHFYLPPPRLCVRRQPHLCAFQWTALRLRSDRADLGKAGVVQGIGDSD